MDLLKDREIDLVVNVPFPMETTIRTIVDKDANMDDESFVKNNFLIRRTAVDFGIPLHTNLQKAMLYVDALAKHKKGEMLFLDPNSLFDYYTKDKAVGDIWTSTNEFH